MGRQQEIGFSVKNWKTCHAPSRENMQGRFCRLTPLNADKHAKDLSKAYAKDTKYESWIYLPYGPFANYKSYYSWVKKNSYSNDPLFYTIINLKNNSAIGVASFLRIYPDIGSIEVGHIHYSPLLQKTIMATEAMYLMMYRVFAELKYRRYEWKCDALNKKSRNAALRLGFTFEGIFRQSTIYKKRNRDTAWYSIIDTEWPKLKKTFTLWLDPLNFDNKGMQKATISQLKNN